MFFPITVHKDHQRSRTFVLGFFFLYKRKKVWHGKKRKSLPWGNTHIEWGVYSTVHLNESTRATLGVGYFILNIKLLFIFSPL